MATDRIKDEGSCLQDFTLYETISNFYMVGSDKSKDLCRVLKIDRLEPCELSILEDSATYTESECSELLKRIHEGNRSTGGLKFVTRCYGIVGFVRFLGPYYMLLITKRKEVGSICGHAVYAVSESKMIVLPSPAVMSNMAVSKKENRYKKLLYKVDLTKDFYFSYSYHVMRSLQRNLCDGQTGQVLYETMFVWNEFLTRGLRYHLKSSLWTVALVHGFFKQVKLSVSGRDFNLTLIARRSRHYAGTRYLKRGVNEKGRVANDVEIEQIVSEENSGGLPMQISSVVQNRGSIPLFWSQETSRLNLKPDIVLKKGQNFEATRLHFENLVRRYGIPILILNLIKTREKKPRETILRAEFANAIDIINKDLSEENRLRFLHWDLHKHSRRNAIEVLETLRKVAMHALNLTGCFYCQISPVLSLDGALRCPILLKDAAVEMAYGDHQDDDINNNNNTDESSSTDGATTTAESGSQGENTTTNSDSSLSGSENNDNGLVKIPKFQNGVLRTNCIDCLDRTNVAQYAYGLAALGYQLHALGFISIPKIDSDAPLAGNLMDIYETMGDTLSLQYGGSAAHNKIFSARRGQWKATIQSQEFLRTMQRYYSNAYMDPEKQNAINLFLGHFQPQQDKPELWELESDEYYSAARPDNEFDLEHARSIMKRTQSDGNVLRERNTPESVCNLLRKSLLNSAMADRRRQEGNGGVLSNSTPNILTCESDISDSSCTSMMPGRRLFAESALDETATNFLDLDWLFSSGKFCEEETFERSTVSNSPVGNLSMENVINELTANLTPPLSENGLGIKGKDVAEMHSSTCDVAQSSTNLSEFSESFVCWVNNGGTLCY